MYNMIVVLQSLHLRLFFTIIRILLGDEFKTFYI